MGGSPSILGLFVEVGTLLQIVGRVLAPRALDRFKGI